MKNRSSATMRQRQPLMAKILLKSLKTIQSGSLQVTAPDGAVYEFAGPREGINARIRLHDWAVGRKLLLRGDIGFAEAYRDGLWSSEDLPGLFEFAFRNEEALRQLHQGQSLMLLIQTVKNRFLRDNSRRLSRRNIRRHYDLGNDFFRLWLDETMTYSSAYFREDYDRELSRAQRDKYQRVLDLTRAAPGDHILEIGCGWGGFAEYAARKGFKVRSVTISREQYDYAVDRIARQGLSSQAEIALRDYRDIEGQYDSVVSIEMIEAVGSRHWETYFRKIRDVLKKGATAVIQGITIRDELFEAYQKGTDFIQQFIFPGGMLIAETLVDRMASRLGLEKNLAGRFGLDYAETLRRWRREFNQAAPQLERLGYDDRFRRIWNFYLASCEGGFKAGKINVIHAVLRKVY